MTKIRMDFIPCLLIGGLLLGLVTFAGNKYLESANEKYDTQEIPEGEIGGAPSADTPQVGSIAEMKQNDLFYVVTEDFNYEMYHLFYDDKEWNALELPSGEVVCVRSNSHASETVDGYKIQTPVGCIVSFDVPDSLADQLDDERGMTFSDTSFYVDMMGGRLEAPDDDEIKFRFDALSVLAFFLGTIFSHMLGAKIGILPPVFPKRKKSEA